MGWQDDAVTIHEVVVKKWDVWSVAPSVAGSR
jgi:hypothetical protein